MEVSRNRQILGGAWEVMIIIISIPIMIMATISLLVVLICTSLVALWVMSLSVGILADLYNVTLRRIALNSRRRSK